MSEVVDVRSLLAPSRPRRKKILCRGGTASQKYKGALVGIPHLDTCASSPAYRRFRHLSIGMPC